MSVHLHSYHDTNAPVRSPLSPLETQGRLGGKKVVKFHQDCNKENVCLSNSQNKTPPTSPQKIKKYYAQDKECIQAAVGKKTHLNFDEFHKEHANSTFTLMKLTFLKLAEMRNSGKREGEGELGIKNWKFVVILDSDNKISKLFVGKFLDEGSFTDVYLTLNNEAILIPKKCESSEIQLFRAHRIISSLHKIYESMQDFAKETRGVFQHFGLSKTEIMRFLPTKTKMIEVESRPILIAPQAECFEKEIQQKPTSLEDVIYRIDLFVKVALGVALMHNAGFVHGDLKPANMLKGSDGIVRPHDLGGGEFFYRNDNLEKASTRMLQMTRSPMYTHYEDYYRFNFTEMDKDEYYSLGCAGDVFALGVSLIEVLGGRYFKDGVRKYPFEKEFYIEYKNKVFVYNSYEWRRFTCVEKISPEINQLLVRLIDNALNPEYKERYNIIKFTHKLNIIGFMLKEVLEKTQLDQKADN